MELAGQRVLVFVVAYDAESTIASVIRRIPAEMRQAGVEVLVIDDCSRDATFDAAVLAANSQSELRITVLRNPENQGYGGNQKLGYRYAIDNRFDIVALIHGDGQYGPEELPKLVGPLLRGEADAVFGSRMMRKLDALRGRMPAHKWIGNIVLTRFQNLLLGTDFSEFHSGFRLYSTQALARVPFEYNSDGFRFDTDIIIQFVLAGLKIAELPIATHYGDEVCHVNGLAYAWECARAVMRARCHRMGIFYDRRFDVTGEPVSYELKLGYTSSHTEAIAAVRPGARVLDIGCGPGFVSRELAERASQVVGIDTGAAQVPAGRNLQFFRCDLEGPALPVAAEDFDQILMLDVLEHLGDPEGFLTRLRSASLRTRPEVIVTTPNIAFFVTRLGLLLGQFNYGRLGILDRTHRRLFTFASLRELLEQTGFRILEMRGIPAPFPKALGGGWLGRVLLRVHAFLIPFARGFWSYQILVRAVPRTSLEILLENAVNHTRTLGGGVMAGAEVSENAAEVS